MSEQFFDLQRFVEIRNYTSNTLLSGTSGNDSIENGSIADNLLYVSGGKNVTISSGDGNDTVASYKADYVSINSGAGDDYIYDNSDYATAYAGDGNDTITGHFSYGSVNAGAGNDYISLYNWHKTTIKGGKGNDTIYGYNGGGSTLENGEERKGILYQYSTGDGNDLIYSFSTKDTLSISGGSYSTTKMGLNIIVTVDTGKITLSGAASLSKVNIKFKKTSSTNSKLITLTAGNDTYNNSVKGATINALGGKDTIYNYAASVAVDGGAGNNSIFNNAVNVSIVGGNGNDTIWNGDDVLVGGYYTTIVGGDGNDYIYSRSNYVSISGGAGNDSITANELNVTINGGTGNDLISLSSDRKEKKLIKYTSGDGNDIIYGFNSTSTLSISGGTYSTTKSGSNLIVTVGDGKITLAGVTSANIKGTKTVTEKNSWKLSGTTATYGTASKTLVTVKGIKSLDGISLSNKVVTIAASALNKSNVTISGGYTLKLADDVSTTATTKNSWSYKNSVATLKQTRGEKYSLASNRKSITYSAATSKNLAKLSGVKSKSGLKVSDKVITVPNSIIGSKKKVSVSGSGYNFKFSAKKTLITGSANADIITSTGANSTINGGKGNDQINLGANNFVVYKNGDGTDTVNNYSADDTIKITSGAAQVSTSGSNVVFSVGNGSILLKGAADKNVTYLAGGTKKTYSASSSKPYTMSKDGKAVTLSSSYAEKTFDVNNITNGEKVVTIDASAVTHKLKIKGNELANKIIGGSAGGTLDGGKGTVSDTLIGGDGADIFIYYEGDGNDVISGCDAKDTIKIETGIVSTIKPSREDVVFQVGDGKLTVQDVKGTHISFVEDGIEYGCLDSKRTLTISQTKNDTIATLSKNYRKESFDVTKIGNEDVGNSITQIYASAVSRTLKITGNDNANQIMGSATKANTITGGGGDDTLQGGSGADVFVYAAGDGNDLIIGYDKSDKISVTSGTVDNVSLNSDNAVILTIGAGKIILDNAGGKKFTYYDVNHAAGISSLAGVYSPGNVAESWFVADDDNFAVDNDLSALVQSNAKDYSLAEIQTSLPSANDLTALTYSSKK